LPAAGWCHCDKRGAALLATRISVQLVVEQLVEPAACRACAFHGAKRLEIRVFAASVQRHRAFSPSVPFQPHDSLISARARGKAGLCREGPQPDPMDLKMQDFYPAVCRSAIHKYLKVFHTELWISGKIAAGSLIFVFVISTGLEYTTFARKYEQWRTF
jgi:hypothetical protein